MANQKRTRKENGEGSVRKLDNGVWEAVVTSKYINPAANGPKRIKRRANTEKKALEIAKRDLSIWERQFITGTIEKIDKTKAFGKYMEEFLDDEVKPNITASAYYSYVRTMGRTFYNRRIANLQLNMLNHVEFQMYYDEIASEMSRKTCSLPVQLTRRCCKSLVDRKLLVENYAMQAELRKEVVDEYNAEKDESLATQKKVFTPDDIEKFYQAYKDHRGEYPVVVLFLLETGLRASEFASLKIKNVHFDTGRIDIKESRAIRFIDNDKTKGTEWYVKHPKNGEYRFVMMSDLAMECAKYMMKQTEYRCKNNPEGLLYPTFRNGKRRTNSSMEVCFSDLCRKIGVDRDVRVSATGQKKGLSLHSLRHTADTIANTAKGANVVNTAMMMGHKAITVENVYTHPTEEALRSVATPSQVVLDEYKRNDNSKENKTINDQSKMSAEDKELYEMYLRLKEKFE